MRRQEVTELSLFGIPILVFIAGYLLGSIQTQSPSGVEYPFYEYFPILVWTALGFLALFVVVEAYLARRRRHPSLGLPLLCLGIVVAVMSIAVLWSIGTDEATRCLGGCSASLVSEYSAMALLVSVGLVLGGVASAVGGWVTIAKRHWASKPSTQPVQ